jgi:excinuclease ABC subunit B
MYADRVTDSMRRAIDETNRRRAIQRAYNEERGITPRSIQRDIRTLADRLRVEEDGAAVAEGVGVALAALPKDEIARIIKDLESQMKRAAKELEFEKAANLRDQIVELRRAVLE